MSDLVLYCWPHQLPRHQPTNQYVWTCLVACWSPGGWFTVDIYMISNNKPATKRPRDLHTNIFPICRVACWFPGGRFTVSINMRMNSQSNTKRPMDQQTNVFRFAWWLAELLVAELMLRSIWVVTINHWKTNKPTCSILPGGSLVFLVP